MIFAALKLVAIELTNQRLVYKAIVTVSYGVLSIFLHYQGEWFRVMRSRECLYHNQSHDGVEQRNENLSRRHQFVSEGVKCSLDKHSVKLLSLELPVLIVFTINGEI